MRTYKPKVAKRPVYKMTEVIVYSIFVFENFVNLGGVFGPSEVIEDFLDQDPTEFETPTMKTHTYKILETKAKVHTQCVRTSWQKVLWTWNRETKEWESEE